MKLGQEFCPYTSEMVLLEVVAFWYPGCCSFQPLGVIMFGHDRGHLTALGQIVVMCMVFAALRLMEILGHFKNNVTFPVIP